ncbi:MAG: hypothetical protein IT285_12660 [Bdellovibrionales bacterium]|nr:hypothetical protein [Bdellovibrionales bacterium]
MTFMPEGLSFPLTIAGVVLVLESSGRSPNWPRLSWGAALIALGVAAKPTAVVTLLGGALQPLFARSGARQIARIYLCFAAALILPAYWYTVHASDLLAGFEGPQIFNKGEFAPLTRLLELDVEGIWKLLLREIRMAHFPYGSGWLFLALAAWRRDAWPLLGYLVAFTGSLALDGRHIIAHPYYFIGCAAFSTVIIARSITHSSTPEWLRAALTGLLIIGVAYGVRTNVISVAKSPTPIWGARAALVPRIPPGFMVVTDDGQYPTKLLALALPGLNAGKRIWSLCAGEPDRSRRFAFVVNESTPLPGESECEVQEAARWVSGTRSWVLYLRTPR